MQAGIVTHRYLGDLVEEQRSLAATTGQDCALQHHQLMAYALCLRDYGKQHRWLGEQGVATALWPVASSP